MRWNIHPPATTAKIIEKSHSRCSRRGQVRHLRTGQKKILHLCSKPSILRSMILARWSIIPLKDIKNHFMRSHSTLNHHLNLSILDYYIVKKLESWLLLLKTVVTTPRINLQNACLSTPNRLSPNKRQLDEHMLTPFFHPNAQ